jgi:hypothetical protein
LLDAAEARRANADNLSSAVGGASLLEASRSAEG